MKKALSVLAVVCAALGIPLAGLVFLAGGMKAAPGLDPGELAIGLPLVLLAVLFGGITIAQCRLSKVSIPGLVLASVIVSSLAIIVLVSTYFEYR